MKLKKKIEELSNSHIDHISYDIRERLFSDTGLSRETKNGEFLKKAITFLNGDIQISDNKYLEHEEGILISSNKTFIIYLPSYTSYKRDNFTIAHELGHLILHTHIIENNNEGVNELFFTRFGSNRYEWQANRFATSLLMPKDIFVESAKELKNDVFDLASEFEVPVDIIKLRLSYTII